VGRGEQSPGRRGGSPGGCEAETGLGGDYGEQGTAFLTERMAGVMATRHSKRSWICLAVSMSGQASKIGKIPNYEGPRRLVQKSGPVPRSLGSHGRCFSKEAT
jgi:hypothetical protein